MLIIASGCCKARKEIINNNECKLFSPLVPVLTEKGTEYYKKKYIVYNTKTMKFKIVNFDYIEKPDAPLYKMDKYEKSFAVNDIEIISDEAMKIIRDNQEIREAICE